MDATAASSDLRDEQTAYREASKKVDGSNQDGDEGEAKTPAADVDEAPPAAEKTSDGAAPHAPATLEKYGWVAWPPPNPPPAA